MEYAALAYGIPAGRHDVLEKAGSVKSGLSWHLVSHRVLREHREIYANNLRDDGEIWTFEVCDFCYRSESIPVWCP